MGREAKGDGGDKRVDEDRGERKEKGNGTDIGSMRSKIRNTEEMGNKR